MKASGAVSKVHARSSVEHVAVKVAQSGVQRNANARSDRQRLIGNEADHPRSEDRKVSAQRRIDAEVAEHVARTVAGERLHGVTGFAKITRTCASVSACRVGEIEAIHGGSDGLG